MSFTITSRSRAIGARMKIVTRSPPGQNSTIPGEDAPQIRQRQIVGRHAGMHDHGDVRALGGRRQARPAEQNRERERGGNSTSARTPRRRHRGQKVKHS